LRDRKSVLRDADHFVELNFLHQLKWSGIIVFTLSHCFQRSQLEHDVEWEQTKDFEGSGHSLFKAMTIWIKIGAESISGFEEEDFREHGLQCFYESNSFQEIISTWMLCVAEWDENRIKIVSFEGCDRCFPFCPNALNSNTLAESRWWDRFISVYEWHFAGAASIWERKWMKVRQSTRKCGEIETKRGFSERVKDISWKMWNESLTSIDLQHIVDEITIESIRWWNQFRSNDASTIQLDHGCLELIYQECDWTFV
jgi:hypothetical protein